MFVSIPYHNNTTYIAIAHIVEIQPNGDDYCKVFTATAEKPCTLSANELIRRIDQIVNPYKEAGGSLPDIHLADISKT